MDLHNDSIKLFVDDLKNNNLLYDILPVTVLYSAYCDFMKSHKLDIFKSDDNIVNPDLLFISKIKYYLSNEGYQFKPNLRCLIQLHKYFSINQFHKVYQLGNVGKYKTAYFERSIL